MSSADAWLGENILLHLSLVSVTVDQPSVRPRLIFAFELANSAKKGTRSYDSDRQTDIVFGMMVSEVRQLTSKGESYIGNLIPKNILESQTINSRGGFQLCLDSNVYEIGEIEKLREAKDLQLTITLWLVAEAKGDEKRTNNCFQIRYRIPKSDWVENFLPALGVKNVSLIEIPQLTAPEFQETISLLNDAWKQYSLGEYSRVLSDCRKAMEITSQKVKEQGFVETVVNKESGEKNIYPDWNKFTENEELGDAMAAINRKLFRLSSTGAHGMRNIAKEDANFVLMTTHAMVNLVVQKANKTK
jgi:hypothetical protein